jgi:predicted nucleic acid-binding protein
VHAATALASGFTQIVSCDGDFDGIPGLERLDPVAGRVTG